MNERGTPVHPASAVPPSGEQIELIFGDQEVVVTEVGAGLRRYSAGTREVLDGYAVDELAPSGRGQLLLPWPNRIRDGVYRFKGRDYQLPLTEPERGNAIHGLTRWSSWTVVERADDRVVLEYLLHPQPGYPFLLELQVEYTLAQAGLTVRTTARNAGREPCPYGGGAHPYLTVGPGGVDEAVLRIPAATMLKSDDRGIPVGAVRVEGARDFRRPRAIGTVQLDHCFTELDRGVDRLARVELDGTTLWADERYPYLMVFTGDSLPDAARRSVAVEPMTCAPNAFASGDGLIVLEPAEEHAAAWGITPRAAA